MRWDELFDDLAAELAASDRADRDAEVADRTRAELGRLAVLDRLRASLGCTVKLRLAGAGLITGKVQQVGAGWLLVAAASDVLVPAVAILAVDGMSREAASPAPGALVASRLTLASALRAVALDRARVTVVLLDGTTIAGTPDRIGSDFLDLAVHSDEVAPRSSAVSRHTTVPFSAIGAVIREAYAWE